MTEWGDGLKDPLCEEDSYFTEQMKATTSNETTVQRVKSGSEARSIEEQNGPSQSQCERIDMLLPSEHGAVEEGKEKVRLKMREWGT